MPSSRTRPRPESTPARPTAGPRLTAGGWQPNEAEPRPVDSVG
ncbi:hypothetical protein ACFPRL_04315 [Pseudoclavibacter helvolus]